MSFDMVWPLEGRGMYLENFITISTRLSCPPSKHKTTVHWLSKWHSIKPETMPHSGHAAFETRFALSGLAWWLSSDQRCLKAWYYVNVDANGWHDVSCSIFPLTDLANIDFFTNLRRSWKVICWGGSLGHPSSMVTSLWAQSVQSVQSFIH